MANTDAPSGLTPVGHLLGLNWSARCQMYCIPETDDTNAFAIGDPVVLAGDADTAGVPTITLATAGTGNAVLGCIVSGAGATIYGGTPGVPAETPIVIPATKTRNYYVMVADDPNIIFAIQEDSVGETIAAASIGLNANLISGTNNGYISGWELDSSSKASGATLQLKILRARQINNNTLGVANCVFEVLINNHVFKAGVAGI